MIERRRPGKPHQGARIVGPDRQDLLVATPGVGGVVALEQEVGGREPPEHRCRCRRGRRIECRQRVANCLRIGSREQLECPSCGEVIGGTPVGRAQSPLIGEFTCQRVGRVGVATAGSQFGEAGGRRSPSWPPSPTNPLEDLARLGEPTLEHQHVAERRPHAVARGTRHRLGTLELTGGDQRVEVGRRLRGAGRGEQRQHQRPGGTDDHGFAPESARICRVCWAMSTRSFSSSAL